MAEANVNVLYLFSSLLLTHGYPRLTARERNLYLSWLSI